MIDEGPDTAAGLQAMADRHGVTLDAVQHLMRALENGHGTMAQFNHPDLGGFGQWSAGGMIMIGQMFDTNLKARVAALCDELAGSLPPIGSNGPDTTGTAWWPTELGRPATSGAQNATRYAYFPETRRLAVETNGTLALYDTAEHDITGVSQQQGGGHRLRFTGRNGSVDLEALKRVDGSPAQPRPFEPEPFRSEPVHVELSPAQHAAPEMPAVPSIGGDVLATLERLSDLQRKGVLTEAEFAAKKAELLARL